MTQEDKELLLKDLCARLPYGVIVQQSPKHVDKHFADKWETVPHDFNIIGIIGTNTLVTDKNTTERTYMKGIVSKPVTICIYDGLTKQTARPYLRPMSSMTKEEKQELERLINEKLNRNTDQEDNEWTPWVLHDTTGIRNSIGGERFYFDEMSFIYDWLNAHYFDYRGLIEKGLAIEAPKGMYNLKNK